jgi:hypothetical protein
MASSPLLRCVKHGQLKSALPVNERILIATIVVAMTVVSESAIEIEIVVVNVIVTTIIARIVVAEQSLQMQNS